jgi:hypothetical protein
LLVLHCLLLILNVHLLPHCYFDSIAHPFDMGSSR